MFARIKKVRNFVSAKIHGVRVTDKSIHYTGSVSICGELMDAAGISEYEKVQVVNLTNGQRWETYALKADDGQFTLNGGGARLGEINDECVVICYSMMDEFEPFDVIFCDDKNNVRDVIRYENP